VRGTGPKAGSAESWDTPLKPLLSRVLAELGSVKRVVLAPHAFGHLIPWPAAFARIGWKAPGQALLPVVTIPTLKVLPSFLAPATQVKGRAVVVGNPRGDLKFAEDEARMVSAKLGTKPLIREKATKSALLRQLPDASVVHLATHAYWEQGNSLESGIVLADGVLTAREVMQHRLRTDLLVLSACETGLAGSLGGDELAGLGRAFMHAGARSILVSLWEVDDKATASLMNGFYEAYAGGIDKAAALASAMARVRAQQAWQHTHYWGAFTLMGHWS
jgi:CHAT domain-containing protein